MKPIDSFRDARGYGRRRHRIWNIITTSFGLLSLKLCTSPYCVLGAGFISNAGRFATPRRVDSLHDGSNLWQQESQTSITRLFDNVDENSKSEPSISFENVTSVVIQNNDASTNGKSNGKAMNERNANNMPGRNNTAASWTQNLYDYAKGAAGTLGDIMSREQPVSQPQTRDSLSSSLDKRDGLVTTVVQSGSLASRFGITDKLDRMALTANGNLQRLVSSYYDSPVQVLVDFCEPINQEENGPSVRNNAGHVFVPMISPKAANSQSAAFKLWERVVHLTVHNQTFCTAHSLITVYDPNCQELVESGAIGIGQLFRYLDILPEFELHNAGLHTADRGGFWRQYTLRCKELSCDIHEDFSANMWSIQPTLNSENRQI